MIAMGAWMPTAGGGGTWIVFYRLYVAAQHNYRNLQIFCEKVGKYFGAILVECLCHSVILVYTVYYLMHLLHVWSWCHDCSMLYWMVLCIFFLLRYLSVVVYLLLCIFFSQSMQYNIILYNVQNKKTEKV